MLVLIFFVNQGKISPRVCISVLPLKLWRMHLDCDSLLECFCQCREKVEILISALERCQLSVALTAGGFVWYTWKVANWSGDLAQPCRCSLSSAEGREGSPPSTCWTLPRAAQGSIHPLCREGRVLTRLSGGDECGKCVSLQGRSVDGILLSVKYLKLLHPSQTDLISNRAWGGQKWGLKSPACSSIKLLWLFL